MMSTGIPIGLGAVSAGANNWVPNVPPLEPFMTFNFAVEIEGLLIGGFSRVTGLGSSIEMESYREGGVNGYVHQLPKSVNHSNLVLQHGLTAISTLWNWYHNATRGVIARKNGTIMLLNRQQIPVMWWNFRNALPVSWTGPTFDASSDQVGFESIELVHQGVTKPLLGQATALAHGAAQMSERWARNVPLGGEALRGGLAREGTEKVEELSGEGVDALEGLAD